MTSKNGDATETDQIMLSVGSTEILIKGSMILELHIQITIGMNTKLCKYI